MLIRTTCTKRSSSTIRKRCPKTGFMWHFQETSHKKGLREKGERERGEGGRGRRGSNILTRYVQHLIKEHAEEVWDIVGAGEGYFYISGIPSFCLLSTPH